MWWKKWFKKKEVDAPILKRYELSEQDERFIRAWLAHVEKQRELEWAELEKELEEKEKNNEH